MLFLSKYFMNRKILSLRIGGPIGKTTNLLINPNNLKIEGWHASSSDSSDSMILPAGEVREIISKGIVVDDHDSLTHPEDLIRLQKIIDADFNLSGKLVVSNGGRRIGKVQDFSVDNDSMYIKKLYTSQSLFKMAAGTQLTIDRNQIIEITDKKIVIKDPSEKIRSIAATPLAA